jgi:DNA (cytosine-5)-methyltransferase 1
MLTVGSLFSGIGGIDLGLERAGMRVLWQVEIDEWCRRVLAKHWPDVPKYGDIRNVRAQNLAPVDVLAGGFPCQDISYAGSGLGITGPRSGLWSEFGGLVCELRPRWVFVENVPALLTRGLGVVLGDLAALGYDAEWDCISAAAVGAPHLRERIWVVAYRKGDAPCAHADSQRPHREEADAAGQELQVQSRNEQGRDPRSLGEAIPDTDGRRRESRAELYRNPPPYPADWHSRGDDPDRRRSSSWWEVEPSVGRVADGVPRRVDRLRGLGNAVVPQVVEWIGRRIVEAEAEQVA